MPLEVRALTILRTSEEAVLREPCCLLKATPVGTQVGFLDCYHPHSLAGTLNGDGGIPPPCDSSSDAAQERTV